MQVIVAYCDQGRTGATGHQISEGLPNPLGMSGNNQWRYKMGFIRGIAGKTIRSPGAWGQFPILYAKVWFHHYWSVSKKNARSP